MACKADRRLFFALCVAAALWFYMFSPWTGSISNFWLNMCISAVVLSSMAIPWSGVMPRYGAWLHKPKLKDACLQLLIGVALAFALWGIFWIGDKLSQFMFSFARGQVDNVYAMKDGSALPLIAVLLLFLIGPAEEFFWRGYVQKTMSERIGANAAFIVTAIVYALVHIWSFNFMLVMAALVAGGIWGLIYRLKPSLLPALVVSHALWDTLVFVILPI